MHTIPYLGQTLYRWHVGNSTFLALPENGARLMNWHITLGDGTVRDVIYWPELNSLEDVAKVRGGNPILFPFAARTFDQGQIGWWKAPDGRRLPMPNHGFARQGKFELTRADDRGFTASFIPDAEAHAGYPFSYEFSVVYRFSGLSLTCEMVLKNTDQQPIPWCPGHHFYFTIPWIDGQRRGDYQIRIPAQKTLVQTATGALAEGPKLKPSESLDNGSLVDTYHASLTGNTATVSTNDGADGVLSVRNGIEPVPDKDAIFVTWITDDDAPYYCVEPWMGPANAPEHGVGLKWVQPGKTGTFVVEVALSSF